MKNKGAKTVLTNYLLLGGKHRRISREISGLPGDDAIRVATSGGDIF